MLKLSRVVSKSKLNSMEILKFRWEIAEPDTKGAGEECQRDGGICTYENVLAVRAVPGTVTRFGSPPGSPSSFSAFFQSESRCLRDGCIHVP